MEDSVNNADLLNSGAEETIFIDELASNLTAGVEGSELNSSVDGANMSSCTSDGSNEVLEEDSNSVIAQKAKPRASKAPRKSRIPIRFVSSPSLSEEEAEGEEEGEGEKTQQVLSSNPAQFELTQIQLCLTDEEQSSVR